MNYVFLITFVIYIGILVGVLAAGVAIYGIFFEDKDDGTGR